MSWSDVYPIFSDDQISEYQNGVSEAEDIELSGLFDVKRIVNGRTGNHIVAASLFWKNTRSDQPELPELTREILINARQLGIVARYPPWEHYVQPLICGATTLREERPDIVFRVYLAADLEFLVEDLVAVGCEVRIMKGSSIRHNPGAMWRFLAFSEEGRWITVTDADRANDILADVQRTELIMGAGLGCWRFPYIYGGLEHHNARQYRPMIACQFGIVGGYDVYLWMKAFLWHTFRGTMTNRCTLGENEGDGGEIPGSVWPNYGFDEWFLIAVMYPRLAVNGVLTFFPKKNAVASQWLAVDIEYVTWANPQSQIIFFDVHDDRAVAGHPHPDVIS